MIDTLLYQALHAVDCVRPISSKLLETQTLRILFVNISVAHSYLGSSLTHLRILLAQLQYLPSASLFCFFQLVAVKIATMSDPRPKWFITRGPGMYTALIPADELPDSVHLQGVTRIMTGDQVVGMTLVAESPPKQQFSLAPRQFSRPVQPPISESPPALLEPQNPKQFLAPDALVGNGGTTVAKSLSEAEVLSVSSVALDECMYLIEFTERPQGDLLAR